jgi:hypothetical protein
VHVYSVILYKPTANHPILVDKQQLLIYHYSIVNFYQNSLLSGSLGLAIRLGLAFCRTTGMDHETRDK